MIEVSRIVFYPAQIKLLESEPGAVRAVRAAMDRFANRAAAAAPHDSGRGAASIRSDVDPDNPAGRRVSWDQEHYYMIFHEDGFASHPGSHFLRRTFESYVII